MKNAQLYGGSLNAIVMKLLQENGTKFGYEIIQKGLSISKTMKSS